MARKRNNPLSGMFHDPPTETDTPAVDQQEQVTAPIEPIEAPAEPVAADVPTPEQPDHTDGCPLLDFWRKCSELAFRILYPQLYRRHFQSAAFSVVFPSPASVVLLQDISAQLCWPH